MHDAMCDASQTDAARDPTPPSRPRAGDLAQPAVPILASTTCVNVDVLFQAAPGCAALLVTAPERPGRVALISRPRFLQQLAGRFGFGRALFGDAPIADLAEWDPVVLDPCATTQQAASAVLDRPTAARYEELVVRFPTGSTRGTLSAATVLEALSRELAVLAQRDGLTGLANREVLLTALSEQASLSGAGAALLSLDLDRLKQVDDAHGHNAGNLLRHSVAHRLQAAARPHDLTVRLGGHGAAGDWETAHTAVQVALLRRPTEPMVSER